MPERIQHLTSFEGEALEEAISTISLGVFIERLDGLKDRAIGLHDIMTLQPANIKDLAVYLQDGRVNSRLERMMKRNVPNPLLRIVTVRLRKQFPRISAENAHRAARQLFVFILNPPHPEITEVAPIPETSTLRNSLNEALKYLSSEQTPGSIDEQLNDPAHLMTLGLVINTSRISNDPENQGFLLPTLLLNVLKALRDPKAAADLDEWLSTTLLMQSEKREPCIRLLRDLVSIAWVLDSGALLSLYDSGKGRIALYPFRALNHAVGAAKRFFKDYGGDIETIRMLEGLERQIKSRFYEALAGPLKDQVDAQAVEACMPSLIDIVRTYTDWFEEHPDINSQKAVDFALRLIEQSGHRAASFVGAVKGFEHSDLAALVEKEAIQRGLIVLSNPEMKKIRFEACQKMLRELNSHPWEDLMSLDFRELITEDTEQVVFLIVTGTFGPFTVDGHGRMFQELLNYTYYQDDLEKRRTGHLRTQRFVVALPLLDTPHKDFADVGTLEERAGSLLLAATHLQLPRNRFLVSTLLQPKPDDAGSTVRAFHAIANAINSKLKVSLGNVYFAINTVLAFGADELSFGYPEGKPPTLVPLEHQPKKAKEIPSVVVSRTGYLVPMLEGSDIINQLHTATCILYSATRDISSSGAREAVRINRPRGLFPEGIIPFAEKCWSNTARSKRADLTTRPLTEVISVKQINANLVKEYKMFLKGLKG